MTSPWTPPANTDWTCTNAWIETHYWDFPTCSFPMKARYTTNWLSFFISLLQPWTKAFTPRRFLGMPWLSLTGTGLLVAGIFALGLASCDINSGPDLRDPWIGAWIMTDRCSADTSEYELLITRGSNLDDNIFLDGVGLYQVGVRLEAIVIGTRLVIPVQSYQISTFPNLRYEFSGSGSIDAGTEITISYTILTLQDDVIIDLDDCLATGR